MTYTPLLGVMYGVLDAGLNATVDSITTLTNLIEANVMSNMKGTV